MNRAPRRRPGLAQVWGHGRLGEAQVRAPPFPLSGGLLLPREQRCGPGSPRRGPPSAPAAAQTRGEGERAPAPMRLQWRGWSLAREPGAPDVVAAGGRRAGPPGCAAGQGSLRFLVSRRDPCGRGAAPAGRRSGRAGRVFVCGGWRCWTPASPAPSQSRGGAPPPAASRPAGGCHRAAGSGGGGEPCPGASVRGRRAGCGALSCLLPTW